VRQFPLQGRLDNSEKITMRRAAFAHAVLHPRARSPEAHRAGELQRWGAEATEALAGKGSEPTLLGGLASGPSLLCSDEATRRRMLDMERHLRPVRTALFGMLGAALIALGPWIGWWPLAPLAIAVVGFLVADRTAVRSRRPEYHLMVAWVLAQVMIGISALFTGGAHSIFLFWLAIPTATLATRYNARGVIAGVALTVAIILAVGLGDGAAAVAHAPQLLVVPMTLVAGVTMLSTALMHSDVKHRAAAIIDPLTGLFNRQALMQRGAELLARTEASGASLAVLLGDLDHFKEVNDTRGHIVGDQVLRDAANALRLALRAFDHIYRYGGEELVILLPADRHEALATAQRLRAAVRAATPGGVAITISFGIAVSEAAPCTLEELIDRADSALYAAKAAGRNCVRVATPDRSAR
jgi:diguanylate cyclase (GGDEF)-like protein